MIDSIPCPWSVVPSYLGNAPIYTQVRLEHALRVFRKQRDFDRKAGDSSRTCRQLRKTRSGNKELTSQYDWEVDDDSAESDDEYDPILERVRQKKRKLDTRRKQKRKINEREFNDERQVKRLKESSSTDEIEESRSLVVVLKLMFDAGLTKLRILRHLEDKGEWKPMMLRSGKVSQKKAITNSSTDEGEDPRHSSSGNELEIWDNADFKHDWIEAASSSRAMPLSSPDLTVAGPKSWLGPNSTQMLQPRIGDSLASAIVIEDSDEENARTDAAVESPSGTLLPLVEKSTITEPPTVEILHNDKTEKPTTVQETTIMTHYAHPMDLKYTAKPGVATQCSFCIDYRMGVIGHPLRPVRVRIYPESPYTYYELGGGYRATGKASTKMCRDCASDRLMILRCHDPKQPIEGKPRFERLEDNPVKTNELIQDIMLAMKANRRAGGGSGGAPSRSKAPWPNCSLCPGAAQWKCAKRQILNHKQPSSQSNMDWQSSPLVVPHPSTYSALPFSHASSSSATKAGHELMPLFIMPDLGQRASTDEAEVKVELGCGLHLCDACHAFFTAPCVTSNLQPSVREFVGCGNMLDRDALRFFFRREDVTRATVGEHGGARNILGPRADLDMLWTDGMLDEAYKDEDWRMWQANDAKRTVTGNNWGRSSKGKQLAVGYFRQ